ncbi:hypothetical protein Pcinc_028626 [Petrolisthes cinctipes]|uniref:Uncharacterized protein n=1 Tax=Petrolisthes cinctipes TaxID=88211 RepID=A0AAE1K556_PETCI|nr:hypothetical protein Pcinc_028626 [Petrolisthes cinctipes]
MRRVMPPYPPAWDPPPTECKGVISLQPKPGVVLSVLFLAHLVTSVFFPFIVTALSHCYCATRTMIFFFPHNTLFPDVPFLPNTLFSDVPFLPSTLFPDVPFLPNTLFPDVPFLPNTLFSDVPFLPSTLFPDAFLFRSNLFPFS